MSAHGKSFQTDHVNLVFFKGDKSDDMEKMWAFGLAVKELGWV